MQAASTDYLFLLRNTQLEKRLSLTEMQEAMSRFGGWLDRLTKDGKLKAGQPLADPSRIVSRGSAAALSDGPFPESKEGVGGFLLIHAESFDAAAAIADECPLLDYGLFIEVRPIIDRCATMEIVNNLPDAAANTPVLSSTAAD